jgi:hypothetical protein
MQATSPIILSMHVMASRFEKNHNSNYLRSLACDYVSILLATFSAISIDRRLDGSTHEDYVCVSYM